MSRTPGARASRVTVIAELRFDPAHREAAAGAGAAARPQHAGGRAAAACASSWWPPRTSRARWCSTRCSRARPPSRRTANRPHTAWFREARAPYVRRGHGARAAPGGAAVAGRRAVRDAGAGPPHRTIWRPWSRPGFEIRWNELGRTFTEAELIERLDGVVATVAGIEPYNERVLAAAPGAQGRWPGSASATTRSTSPPRPGTASPWPWRSAPTTTPWPTTPWR